MLAKHPWRRVVSPPRAARQPRAPKARRSASQRSTNHQAIDRSGAPRSSQLSLRPLRIASRKRPLVGQDGSDNKSVLGDGDKECEKFFLVSIAKDYPHPEERPLGRVSKDVAQPRRLRPSFEARREGRRAPQDDGLCVVAKTIAAQASNELPRARAN